jgi:hypothetical protein
MTFVGTPPEVLKCRTFAKKANMGYPRILHFGSETRC